MIQAIAGVLLAGLLAGPAWAVEQSDRDAGQVLVERQIEAFRRDDAEAALGFASPGIRDLFRDSGTFLDAVRRNYQPVYRPRSFRVGEARDLDGGFEMRVDIQDGAGVDWDAVYTFEKQGDGTWRISGCRLVRRPGESV